MISLRRLFALATAAAASLAPALALADPAPAAGTLLTDPGLTPQLKILALLTLLSLLPAVVLTMTSFTRVVVVLGFVRHGIGTQQSPPTQVIVGLALFLSAFTMAPVTTAIARDAWEPYSAGRITAEQAVEYGLIDRVITSH